MWAVKQEAIGSRMNGSWTYADWIQVSDQYENSILRWFSYIESIELQNRRMKEELMDWEEEDQAVVAGWGWWNGKKENRNLKKNQATYAAMNGCDKSKAGL